MKIGGLIKSSMIDYPGRISCVVFTCGCNFICPYCHNSDLIPFVPEDAETGFDETEIFRFLEKRKGLLDGLVITGGEPTLQKDIIGFCAEVKKAGYPVKLDTNGSRPDILEEMIDKELVEYYAMDIKAAPSAYTPFLSKKNYSDAIQKSIRLIINSGQRHEFRTTCAKPFVDRKMIKEVADLIQGADKYALQAFNPASVFEPAFFEGQGDPYSDEELTGFQEAASSFVKQCIIR